MVLSHPTGEPFFSQRLKIGSNAALTSASDGPVTGVGSDYILLCRACDELAGAKTLTDETLSELLAACPFVGLERLPTA